jgi:hypothetical protein
MTTPEANGTTTTGALLPPLDTAQNMQGVDGYSSGAQEPVLTSVFSIDAFGLPGAVGPAPPEKRVTVQEHVHRLGEFVVRHTPESIRAIFGAAKEEWGAIEDTGRWALIGRRALLLFNVAGVMAEQFGLNETVIGTVGGHEYQHTHNVLDTAIRTGEVSFFIQAALGLTTIASVRQFPKTTSKIAEAFGPKPKKEKERASETSTVEMNPVRGDQVEVASPRHQIGREIMADATRVLTPVLSFAKKGAVRFWDDFVLGTSIRTVTEKRSAERSYLKNAANVALDATLVAVGAGAASASVARLLLWGRKAGGSWIRTTTDLANFITDPATWVGFSGTRLYSMFRGGKKSNAGAAAAE